MALIITGSGNTFIRYYDTLSASPQDITLPTGVTNSNTRPTFMWYQGITYICGQYSRNLVLLESGGSGSLFKAGIAAPANTPSLAAQGTGITGICIGKVTYVHKVGSSTITESAPSPISNTLTLTNQGRRWSNFPTSSPDARITHVRGYVSVDGSDYALAWEAAAATVFTVAYNKDESVATSALGSLLSTTNGVPPDTRYCEIYHDRAWYAASSSNQYRIWFSAVGKPESVYSLNYFDTRDGEHITGMKKIHDQLLIFCRRSTYSLQGYSAEDFVLSKISQDVGCASHHSIVNIYDRLWFAATDGIYLYDGSFKLLTKDVRQYYKDDYKANAISYENSIAVNDFYWNTYKLLIERDVAEDNRTWYWIGHYGEFEPALGGGRDQPDWAFDVRARNDLTQANYYNNTNGEQVFTGSSDGYVRRENYTINFNDDSDNYSQALYIYTKHYLLDDPGGDLDEGKTFNRVWTYVECESSAWELHLFCGDENATQLYVDDQKNSWFEIVPASAATRVIGGNTYTYVPQVVHWHVPNAAGASGRGITLAIVAENPTNLRFRGFGGTYGPGPAVRGYSWVE